jgi:hypothetical protein
MRRFQIIVRSLADAAGYEKTQRKVWIVGLGAATLSITCCGFMSFVVRWFNEPGSDHYANAEQLKADFDAVHLIEAGQLFGRFRAGLGPLSSRKVFVGTRGREQASLYLEDIYGEVWKVTPDRLFAPFTTPAQWHYSYRNGVASGRWDFTVRIALGNKRIVHDEFSVVLNNGNRMK